MSAVAEVVALCLGFLSVIMVGVSLQNPYWRVSSDDGNVIRTSTIYENLWTSCASDSTGTFNCRDFPSLFALSGSLQASRALMIAALVTGTLGIFATLVGMKCSKVMGENYALKGRLAGGGGGLFLLQGACTLISVSWYAFNITQEFFDPLYPGIKYELGEALFIGWVSGTLALCVGTCLLCSCRAASPEKPPYHYESAKGTVYSARRGFQDTGVPSTPRHYDRNAYV